jgi:hypothetical protein
VIDSINKIIFSYVSISLRVDGFISFEQIAAFLANIFKVLNLHDSIRDFVFFDITIESVIVVNVLSRVFRQLE